MAVLNKTELTELAIESNLLGSDYKVENFQPSSYDLRIGSIFKDNQIISNDFQKSRFTNCVDFRPSEILSMLTLEKVTIPNDCVGTVFAMNSLSSRGLLILNPGHIDPGYSGHISICAINLSKEVKTLSIGDPIFTLIVQKLNKGLPDDQSYKQKNRIFQSRKEEERDFLKTKSKKLSSTFFDLVTGYDDARKILGERIWNYFLRKLGFAVKTIAWLAGVITVLYLIAPDYMPILRKTDKSPKKDSLISNMKIQLDAKDVQIKLLSDSIYALNSKR